MISDTHTGRGAIRIVLRRIASGPLLGWLCLTIAATASAVYGLLTHSLIEGMILGLVLDASILNACAWFAAITFGRTRELRSSWLGFVVILGVLGVAMRIWSAWGHDLSTIYILTLLALGFPLSMVLALAAWMLPLNAPWHLDDVVFSLGAAAFSYLQSFVLLPRLFESRQVAAAFSEPRGVRDGGDDPSRPSSHRSEVKCIDKASGREPHLRIKNVGGINADGSQWKLSEEDAITGIESGKWQLYVTRRGRDSAVVVAWRSGRRYLKSESDEEVPSSLLKLPECQ
jgi:Protein of unknown function (DUF3892)